MRALVVVAVLASAALAGCTGDVEPVSAQSGIGTARAAVEKYLTDPQLVWVGGIEPFRQIMDEDMEINIYADGAQADGKAPIWAYGFVGPEGFAGAVVAGGLGVLADGIERSEERDVDGPALTTFIDSTVAAAALARDPRWPGADRAATVEWEIEADSSPVWQVTYNTPDTHIYAEVDALDGVVLSVEVETWDEVAVTVEPMPVGGFEATGTVTAGASPGPFLEGTGLAQWCSFECIPVEFEVAVPSTVEIHLEWAVFANDFDLALFDSDGEMVTASGSGVGGTVEQIEVQLPPGTYTAAIAPFLVAHDTYELTGVIYG